MLYFAKPLNLLRHRHRLHRPPLSPPPLFSHRRHSREIPRCRSSYSTRMLQYRQRPDLQHSTRMLQYRQRPDLQHQQPSYCLHPFRDILVQRSRSDHKQGLENRLQGFRMVRRHTAMIFPPGFISVGLENLLFLMVFFLQLADNVQHLR